MGMLGDSQNGQSMSAASNSEVVPWNEKVKQKRRLCLAVVSNGSAPHSPLLLTPNYVHKAVEDAGEHPFKLLGHEKLDKEYTISTENGVMTVYSHTPLSSQWKEFLLTASSTLRSEVASSAKVLTALQSSNSSAQQEETV